MYKCVCGAVTDSEIEFYLDIVSVEAGPRLTVDDVMAGLDVGIGCESCLEDVRDMIDSYYDRIESVSGEGITIF